METLGETLKRGWELHQAGKYDQARTIYQQILEVQPKHTLGSFLLGRLELDVGRFSRAVEHLSTAVAGDAPQAVYHATLGRAQQALGRHREAAACYRAALELEPGAADYYVNLANALLHCGESAEAIPYYEKAIEADPAQTAAHNGLGAAFEQQGRLDEAIARYRQAVSLNPSGPHAHYNLGTALLKQGRPADALQPLAAAVQLQPEGDAAQANLAACYHWLGREDEAQEAIERAIALAPDVADHHVSLATVLRHQGRPHEAIQSYEQALAWNPRHAGAVFGRSLVLLSLGRCSEAWDGFEYRSVCNPGKVLDLSQPRWDGSPLENRTLLLDGEKEPSDTLLFARLVNQLRDSGGRVLLAVEPVLLTLLAESGFQGLVSRSESLPQFDVQAPLLSLPAILGLDLDTIPREVPYLDVNSARGEKWREVLSPYQGLKVGVAWQSRPDDQPGDRRSIPLECLSPLSQVAGVQFIGLQNEPSDRPLARDTPPLRITFLEGLEGDGETFANTAAVIRALDLVITSDSVVAHLAGALAVPVWVGLGKTPDWRWLLDRDDSPWYPTMRLFRQSRSGDWTGVAERMAKELADLAAGRQESS